MSDYGADVNPSIPAAQDLAYVMRFLPLKKTNVMQWTYPDDVTVRKLANKTDKSNCLFKFALPPPPPVIPPDLPPVPAGDTCTVCWGNGKPFGVGETPESVAVVIQNIEKGPDWLPIHGEPPNGTFEFIQDVGVPCQFIHSGVVFLMFFQWFTGGSGFAVQNKPLFVISFLAVIGECQTFYQNTIVSEFIGGTATIFIPPIS